MKENSKCVVSFESNSKVYHKPGCHHISKIKPGNQVYMTKKMAEAAGFRMCRCCNGMNHHIRVEENAIDFYKRKKGMEFRYISGVLYVKTEMGCWKLVYSRKEQWFVLYHRNHMQKELDFSAPQYEEYHRQSDIPKSYTIEHYLDYIYEHDKFKQAESEGQRLNSFSSKKNRRLAERSRKKNEKKRVDYLFQMLEAQNKGYQQLSFC